MKKLNLTLAGLLVFAASALAGATLPPVTVPENGGTLGLFAIALTAIALLRRKLAK
ncbi:MAG: hypothetical protein QOG67_1869 [Verrucomicrobiota bacterium]|jgi:hypothetical protein